MKEWYKLKKELLEDRTVRAEYNLLEPEYKLASDLIQARLDKKLSQAALAKK